MGQRPWLSLIVPTRGRPAQLRRFLESIAATAYHPERLEVLLVVDADDPVSLTVSHPSCTVRHCVGQPGRTMGELNNAGYRASSGDHVMLLNDDVIARTPGWDAHAYAGLKRFSDPIVLIHVNDTLLRHHLCVFPLVARTFCEQVGGICPTDYRRYRIDDHIEDLFNLLAALGERRTVYLPDVVFEHLNAVEHATAGRVYESDPALLALDAQRYEELFPQRKELALQLLRAIDGDTDPWRERQRRRFVETIHDSFALRTLGRQCVVRSSGSRFREIVFRLAALFARASSCVRKKGLSGLARATCRQLVSAVGTGGVRSQSLPRPTPQ
jgi:glycosyltransferase involved in cell wall biosynthesis